MSEEVGEILSRATPTQMRWVLARLTSRSDAEAAERVGITRQAVEQWENKAELDRAVNMLLRNAATTALAMLERALIEAARVFLDSLDADDPRLRLRAAELIWDKVGPKPPERREVTRRPIAVKLRVHGEPEPPD